jgi:putative NADH-flavin reductase
MIVNLRKINNMKIAIVGATGFVGTALVAEALNRGHQVTAIARKVIIIDNPHKDLTTKEADAYDSAALAPTLAGHDAVVSAFNSGWTNPNIYHDFIRGSESIQKATKDAGVKRLLVVGGAGSLEIAPGKQLVDTPEFPAAWKDGALGARDYLNILKEENDLDWTFLSPAIHLSKGKRTAMFRVGTDEPVFDEGGHSNISVEDLAVAVIDEVENNKFIKKRFTVGY